NWESAPFSIPVVIGYLFPVHLSYTVQIIVTMLIAGTGAYVLARVLRLSPLASAMTATIFELSGPFIGWLGWGNSSVMSWAGWVFAAVILVLRGERRARSIAFLALLLAFAVYAGDPEEVLVVLVLAPAVLVALSLILRTHALKGEGPLLRPLVDLAAAGAAGLALASPLLLPGLQVASKSNRASVGPSNGPQTLPLTDIVHLFFQGFDGLPLIHSEWFGRSNYVETAMYVGVISLVLAATAVVVRREQRDVRIFSGLVVVMALFVFVHPLVKFLDAHVFGTYWVFAMQPMVLAIAVLSGMGTDVVVRSHLDRKVRQVLVIGFGSFVVLLVMIWLVAAHGLPKKAANIRAHSFILPAIEVVLGLAVLWAVARLGRESLGRRSAARIGFAAGACLLVFETAFLVSAGAPLISSNSTYLKPTPTITALKRAVGDSVVGFGVPCNPGPRAGVLENVNIAYGIQEFSVYDPMTPKTYYDMPWEDLTGVKGGRPKADNLCPIFETASLARLFGVGYVLETQGFSGPAGSVFAGRIGNEDLYRIPGSAAATVVPLSRGAPLPNPYSPGTAQRVTHPGPSSWRIVTDSSSRGVLRLRLTDEPGWHATVNGRPLKLLPFDHVMLQARIPAGRDLVELHYWPTTFSVGLVLALCGALALVCLLVVAGWRHRRRAGANS
ncbi:MAG: YfhO family protein, partial [Nitrososphaerales archaeon]